MEEHRFKYTLNGSLTLPNAGARKQITEAMSKNNVELDFTKTPYIDMEGIKLLKDLKSNIHSKGGSLTFSGMNYVILDTLRVLEPDLFSIGVAR